MSSDIGQREQQICSLAAVGGSEHIRRLALVVENSRYSFTVSYIREQVPTYCIESLAELRFVLTKHFKDYYGSLDSEGLPEGAGMIAIDLSDLPHEDTALFAANLGSVTRLRVLFILSPRQFELFEEGTFDCVVR